MEKNNQLIVFTDGASTGNPGPGWAMWVIKKGKTKNEEGKTIRQNRVRLKKCTNNEAEYKAVQYALEDIVDHPDYLSNIEEIKFKIDSKLVVNQLNGQFKVKNAKIREYIASINFILPQIPKPIIFQYIPREQNIADKLKYS